MSVCCCPPQYQAVTWVMYVASAGAGRGRDPAGSHCPVRDSPVGFSFGKGFVSFTGHVQALLPNLPQHLQPVGASQGLHRSSSTHTAVLRNQGWVSPILSLWALCSQEDCQGSSCSYTSFPAPREASSGHTPASQEDTELPQDRVTSALEQHIPSPEQDMPSPGAGWLLHSSSALGFCCFPNAPNPIICARSLGLQPGHGCRSRWKWCQHKLCFISAA